MSDSDLRLSDSPLPESEIGRLLAASTGTAQTRNFSRFLPGLPKRVEAARYAPGQPMRYTIGWFDFESEPPPKEEEEVEGGSESLPAEMSPAADLLRRLAAVLQPPPISLYTPNGFLEWPAPLLPYQKEGVAALLSRRELLLADDMGLGKTVMTIAALRILYHQEKIASALLVCPASLLIQWRRELAKWASDLKTTVISGSPTERGALWRVPAHIRLISYETLRADVMDLRDSPALRATWDVVILDEASRIKNRDTAISIACKRLPRERRWALTGTPLENSLEDIASLLEFLNEETYINSEPATLIAELRRVQLRRKKEDVLLDLPPKQVNEIALELPSGQREAYDRAEREGIFQLRQAGAELTVTHILELISRLKQICNYDPVSGESAKLADIAQRMRVLSAAGHRALIFSQFTDATFGVGRAAEVLKEFRPLLFTGNLSPQRRAEVVTRFMNDPRHKALLLSLRAGGVGLNLQAASYVFHLDRWWNPAIEAQADSRAHRMGQAYPVTVYRYLCAETIEERIDALLQTKRRMFTEIVDDVSLDISSALSQQELLGLFGLAGSGRSRRGPE